MNKPTRTRPMDNAEFLAELMNHAKTGPILQMVLIAAIDNHTRKIVNTPLEALQKALGPMICAESWRAAALEIQDALEARSKEGRWRVEEQDEEDEVLYVRLDAENLMALREAAMGAISVLEGRTMTVRHSATINALKNGLMLTSGAHVDELEG